MPHRTVCRYKPVRYFSVRDIFDSDHQDLFRSYVLRKSNFRAFRHTSLWHQHTCVNPGNNYSKNGTWPAMNSGPWMNSLGNFPELLLRGGRVGHLCLHFFFFLPKFPKGFTRDFRTQLAWIWCAKLFYAKIRWGGWGATLHPSWNNNGLCF